jgi:hypothetical protein
MVPQEFLSPREKEQAFYRFIVAEYLKYGSVDEVFKRNDYNLPISYPGVHHLLDRWGIVKAAGPNTRISEAITFLSCLAQEKIPLETLYRQMPHIFQTSMGTLHRILTYVRSETIRRIGAALVLSPQNNPEKVLIGNDISPISRTYLGKKYGDISLPMTYASRDEARETSILRILQQEVFTQNTINKDRRFYSIIPYRPQPFMFLDIADVRVAVYQILLPEEFSSLKSFSSFKIEDYLFISVQELAAGNRSFRAGIQEIGRGYLRYLNRKMEEVFEPKSEIADLNRLLAIELG